MDISLIILNYNDSKRCLGVVDNAIRTGRFSHIIVVDNRSDDESIEILERNLPQLRGGNLSQDIILIKSRYNGGFGYGHNLGLKYARETFNSDILFTINTDIIFKEQNIDSCIRYHLKYPEYALISCRIIKPDGTAQLAAWREPEYWQYVFYCYKFLRKYKCSRVRAYKYNLKALMEVDTVRGSFMSFKSGPLAEVDYFDEDNFLYNEENIISKKLRNRGYKIGIITDCFYIHDHDDDKKQSINTLKLANHSGYYYMTKYKNINLPQKVLLKLSIIFQDIYIYFILYENFI